VRVLYFSRDYTPHDHRFLFALAGTDYDIYFLRLERGKRQLEDRVLPEKVKLIRWQGGNSPFRWRDVPAMAINLRRVLGQLKPDLIHAGPVQSAAFLAALVDRGPLVCMSWGSDLLKDADRSFVYRWITRFTLSRSTVLVGDCQAVQRKAAALGFPVERVFLFPWGVDLDHFSPLASAHPPRETTPTSDLRTRLGWQNSFVILSLRSWEPIYGVDLVVRAFATCAAELPELRLLLLGGGSQASLLQSIIHQYQLHDKVYLGGQVNQVDLPRYYRAADLYVSASYSDGSSVSLMEALACAKPVLVSDIPGNREWITPGTQGWMFPAGDVQALANGIRRAVRKRETLSAMSLASRRLAEERADWNKNFKVLVHAYQTAMQLKR